MRRHSVFKHFSLNETHSEMLKLPQELDRPPARPLHAPGPAQPAVGEAPAPGRFGGPGFGGTPVFRMDAADGFGTAAPASLFGELLTGLGVPSLGPELRNDGRVHSRGVVNANLAAGAAPVMPELDGALGTGADLGSSPDSLAPVLAQLGQVLRHAIRPSADPLGLESTSVDIAGVRGSAERDQLQSALTSHPGRLGDAVLRQIAARLGVAHLPDVQPHWPRLLLERFGGFRDRGRGLTAWLVAGIAESVLSDQRDQALDGTMLLLLMIDQWEIDNTLDLAWLATFAEDPPATLWTQRQNIVGTTNFSLMIPARWRTVLLAYIREQDLIATRRQEALRTHPAGVSTVPGGSPPATTLTRKQCVAARKAALATGADKQSVNK